MKTWLRPYKLASKSAIEIANALSIKRTRGDKRLLGPSLVFNWGSSAPLIGRNLHVINSPSNVALAANKLDTFISLSKSGILTPAFTTNASVASEWLSQGKVYARRSLTGSQGSGIVVCVDELVAAPLYTKGLSVVDEYRVHVFSDAVLDFTVKRKRKDTEVSLDIRNSINGWVFCRQDETLPDTVATQAIKAVSSLGLDFGAVDVVTTVDGLVYILEINTAPGVEGTTLERYKIKFMEVISEAYNKRQIRRDRNRMHSPQVQQRRS